MTLRKILSPGVRCCFRILQAIRSYDLCRRFKRRVNKICRGLYYGPLRCARVFRVVARPSAIMPDALVIVCERHRFIYYSIPKTGCTTVKSLILEAEGRPLPEDREQVHRELEQTPQSRIQTPLLNSYFKFAFVRNPWSRLVSCYCNKVLDLRPSLFSSFASCYPYIHFEKMSFSDFVRFVCRVPNDLCEPHFKPQSAFFNAGEVDFVGRFERFSEDFARVIERVGLDERFRKWCDIRRMKSSNGRHYSDFYDAETRRLVAEKYKEDIERFSYRFGE